MIKHVSTVFLILLTLLPTHAEDRPNLLFIIADDWSYGHAGVYGCNWVETPNFDRVAREGILFHNTFTPNAKCAPSRAIILTGRHSWQLEDAANHWCYFPKKYGSFMQRLERAGYETAYTGKGWAPGVVQTERFVGRPVTPKNKSYADSFQNFIKNAPKDKPWAFWLGTREPHRGYKAGSGLAKGKKTTDIDRVPGYWPDTEMVRSDMLDYALEVESVDQQIGQALSYLEDSKQLDTTLIVVTSDHGMPFPRVKGQAYLHSNHVPMAVRWPAGIRVSGREVDDYVSFIDLAPTFLDVAGVSEPGPDMQPMSGKSLVPIFESEKDGRVIESRDHVIIGKERHDIGRPNDGGYPIRGIVKDSMLYIRNYEPTRWPSGNPETGYLNCDGSPTKTLILKLRRDDKDTAYWELCFGKRPAEELYDLKEDPDCLKNLAQSTDHVKLKTDLQNRLSKALIAQEDPRVLGRGAVFETYLYADTARLGFYEKWKAGENLTTPWVNNTDFEDTP